MSQPGPLIVQSDRSILLEVDHPQYEEARAALARFAELVKSPEHIHTYRITAISLWNAASAGMSATEITKNLRALSRYPVAQNVIAEIEEQMVRYGRVRLVKIDETCLALETDDPVFLMQIANQKGVRELVGDRLADNRVAIRPGKRGEIKHALIRVGFPVEDLAGYKTGAPLEIGLRATTLGGRSFRLRPYQREATEIFYDAGSSRGGAGVVVLPCGAGKTIVGLGVMEKLRTKTLILCTNITAVRQWRDEILDKTSLAPETVGEYSGEEKEIRPVTLATYQILVYRKSKKEPFRHFDIFARENWGLIIYDEVHLLPAPIFRATADLQAMRRLGLTATLIREDGKEEEVFSLIGPKRYDVPWKVMEKQGWIAPVECHEIRVPLEETVRVEHAVAGLREQFRLASTNPRKLDVLRSLIAHHAGDNVLIIGQYLDQLRRVAGEFRAPIVMGETPNDERIELYGKFKRGEIKLLVVSKVANFAIDLPDANVAIQISGTFGSRQEEAQRLGRILRPKSDGGRATFYSIITRDTSEQEYAAHRQLFLTEQGYRYYIENGG